MRREPFVIVLIVLGVFWQSVPLAGAVVGVSDGPIPTGPDPNITGLNLTNQTLPSRYAITPAPLRVEVRLAETLLPVAKGEMAAGPRSIGFSVDPASLLVSGILVAAMIAGVWYMMRKKKR